MNKGNRSGEFAYAGRAFAGGVGLILVLSALLGPVSRAGSIFDDDWKPPTQTPATVPGQPPLPPGTPAPPPPPILPPVAPVPPASQTPGSTPAAPSPAPFSPSAATPPRSLQQGVPQGTPLKRRSIPTGNDLARSRDLLKEAFAEQLADRSIPARRRLADGLLKEAAKAGDNPSDQFAIYVGALNAAKEGASLAMVVRVAEEWARAFEVDAASVKTAAAVTMPLKADTPAGTTDNVLLGLDLVARLVAANDFANASKLCSALKSLPVSDAALATVVQKRSTEVDAIRLAHDRVTGSLERIKIAPTDPAANTAVGSYYCFALGQWEAGLPLLAKGSDPDFKKAAEDELAHATELDALIKLGDAWWSLAAKQPAAAQLKIKQHAAAVYSPLVGRASPLQRIRLDKRIAEVGDPNAALAVLSEALVRQKLARFKAFRERFDTRPGVARVAFPVTAEPIETDLTWHANDTGYSLTGQQVIGSSSDHRGKTKQEVPAKITVEPGFRMEGGTLIVAKGSLNLIGEPSKPVVFKNVKILCQLGGSLNATNVVFDNCSFAKVGGWFVAAFSTKWQFDDCLMYQSSFKNFRKTDYGVKLYRSSIVECKFPDRINKPGEKDDSFKLSRHEWSRISECDLFQCELSISAFWMTDRCNFYRCKTAGDAVYSSGSDLPVELGAGADEREPLLADLRTHTTASGDGHVTYSAATPPAANPAFPLP